MDFIKGFSAEQYAVALESWGWLDLAGKKPVRATLFGHVFLASDDGFWLLDPIEGTLTRRWDDVEHLQTGLADPEVQQELLTDLAAEALRRGLTPGPDEILDFIQPPVLGGPIDPENLEPTDFVVGVNLAGQIHAQTTHLAGTQ
ncbi:T6SS immunity protein Tdi1 domain-containing protein [Kribbella sp. NPDC005582]|uniref:T6SS immunity protein Tdi1 domain-containing protein n=1 Tax=Kribbella sp. NPDC005582 TaxID=3156893 RepID=UPI0033B36225